jgi:hypothetical protein
MRRRIKNLQEFETDKAENCVPDSTEYLKEILRTLSNSYIKLRSEFDKRHSEVVSKFTLSDNDKKMVIYKLKYPTHRYFQKYIDKLCADPELNFLDRNIENILRTGNLLILNLLKKEKIKCSGYDIDKFISDPEKFHEGIYNLILGLNGYEHIYLIGDFILSEIPARVYLADSPKLLELVDIWVSGLEIFGKK